MSSNKTERRNTKIALTGKAPKALLDRFNECPPGIPCGQGETEEKAKVNVKKEEALVKRQDVESEDQSSSGNQGEQSSPVPEEPNPAFDQGTAPASHQDDDSRLTKVPLISTSDPTTNTNRNVTKTGQDYADANVKESTPDVVKPEAGVAAEGDRPSDPSESTQSAANDDRVLADGLREINDAVQIPEGVDGVDDRREDRKRKVQDWDRCPCSVCDWQDWCVPVPPHSTETAIPTTKSQNKLNYVQVGAAIYAVGAALTLGSTLRRYSKSKSTRPLFWSKDAQQLLKRINRVLEAHGDGSAPAAERKDDGDAASLLVCVKACLARAPRDGDESLVNGLKEAKICICDAATSALTELENFMPQRLSQRHHRNLRRLQACIMRVRTLTCALPDPSRANGTLVAAATWTTTLMQRCDEVNRDLARVCSEVRAWETENITAALQARLGDDIGWNEMWADFLYNGVRHSRIDLDSHRMRAVDLKRRLIDALKLCEQYGVPDPNMYKEGERLVTAAKGLERTFARSCVPAPPPRAVEIPHNDDELDGSNDAPWEVFPALGPPTMRQDISMNQIIPTRPAAGENESLSLVNGNDHTAAMNVLLSFHQMHISNTNNMQLEWDRRRRVEAEDAERRSYDVMVSNSMARVDADHLRLLEEAEQRAILKIREKEEEELAIKEQALRERKDTTLRAEHYLNSLIWLGMIVSAFVAAAAWNSQFDLWAHLREFNNSNCSPPATQPTDSIWGNWNSWSIWSVSSVLTTSTTSLRTSVCTAFVAAGTTILVMLLTVVCGYLAIAGNWRGVVGVLAVALWAYVSQGGKRSLIKLAIVTAVQVFGPPCLPLGLARLYIPRARESLLKSWQFTFVSAILTIALATGAGLQYGCQWRAAECGRNLFLSIWNG